MPLRGCMVFLMGIVFLFLNSCGQEQQEQSPTTVVRPVETMVVEASSAERQRSFSGVAKAALETNLSFRVSGEIVKLPVKIGMRVKTGDLIAQLDKTEFELEVKKAEARLTEAKAKLKNARDEYERTRILYEAGNVSKSELDQAQAAFQTASAGEEAARKALELAEKQLSYCTLKAPVNGVIGSVPVEVYQTIQAGRVVATLSSEGKMQLEVGVPEALVSQVNVGDPAQVVFEAFPGKTYDAKVNEVSFVLTETTTYPVKLGLLEEDSRIRPGMVGEATLTFKTEYSGQAVIVPPKAVVGRAGQTHYVWIYDSTSSRVHRREVEAGDLVSSGLEILSGLEPGARIVVRGVHRLEENMEVRLLEQEIE
jgi:RND family efflux transporter MFP subunit